MSDNKEIVKIGSKVYEFPRLNYETDKSYYLRRDFFVKASPDTEKDYYRVINMSLVYANTKLLRCVYKKDVMDLMNKYL
jgi:hypothetical protein